MCGYVFSSCEMLTWILYKDLARTAQ